MNRNLFIAVTLALFGTVPARADRISNPIAVFNGLDKITGVTTTFEIPITEERRFGSLVVKPEVCYTRSVTEEPKTTSFVKVEELQSDNSRKPVFSGWMFAESPGLNAVEHPVYDVWLTGCRDPKAPPPVVEAAPQPVSPDAAQEETPED